MAMTTSSIEQVQLQFISELQAARKAALEKLVKLADDSKSDHAKVKALEAVMKYANNFNPWGNV